MTRTLLYALVIAAPLAAQTSPCDEKHNRGNRDRGYHCEVREYTLANAGRLLVDSGNSGGIRILGEDRSNVVVQARVQANAPTDGEAKSLATMVRVEAIAGSVRANGPENLENRGWSVSYEIRAPRRSALELKANNGGISIADVEGDIHFETRNGGVTLQRLAGDVRGRTVNGGLRVELEGLTWRGHQLDVQTTNGGIRVALPSNYSARFETATTNGGVVSDVPGAQLSKREQQSSFTMGSGGPLVRLQTVNGGIHLSRS